MVPISIVSGQSGSFQREYRACQALAHGSEQATKSYSFLGPTAGPAKVLINDNHLRKAQLLRSLSQCILPFFALQVIANLIRRRLTNVDIGSALQMLDSNLLAHAASAHPSSQYSPAVPSRDFDSFPARIRAVWPKALRLRSESCAAVSPDSPCCAS